MHDDELQVDLEGAHGEMDPRAVAEAITALDRILRGLPGEATPTRLASLSVGSARISVRSDEDRVNTVLAGIEALDGTQAVPNGWSADSVAGLLDLHAVSARRGVESVLLRTEHTVIAISTHLAEQARASVAPRPASLGSVRGVLYRYNNGDKRSAGLQNARTGDAVEILFSEELVPQVRSALDQEVEVWGEVRRDGFDRLRSITISGLEVLQSSRSPVTVNDVAGMLGPEWAASLDSVEWVRRQRD